MSPKSSIRKDVPEIFIDDKNENANLKGVPKSNIDPQKLLGG